MTKLVEQKRRTKNYSGNRRAMPASCWFLPIAFEDIGDPNVPVAKNGTANLAKYTKAPALKLVASDHGCRVRRSVHTHQGAVRGIFDAMLS